jgi:restriction system protein
MNERVFPPAAQMSSEEFELYVAEFMRRETTTLPGATVEHLKKIKGLDGTYEIDVLLTFQVAGALYKTLIECKKHSHPIKRDLVQVLADRVRSLGAQKGMIFTTSSYQTGAIEYGQAHGISLVTVSDFLPEYETRSLTAPEQPKNMTLWRVGLKSDSWTMRRFSNKDFYEDFEDRISNSITQSPQ